MEHAASSSNGQEQLHPYLEVTQEPDGRYCIVYTKGKTTRRSYAPTIVDVVRQAQRAGNIPVHTTDDQLQQSCREADLPLI